LDHEGTQKGITRDTKSAKGAQEGAQGIRCSKGIPKP